MAIVKDPSGAPFGLWQAHTGAQIVGEPDTCAARS
jgi:hypothetical protein